MPTTPLGKIELSENVSIIGRSLKDLEKYGNRGTGYIGKVVMSAGEKPVLIPSCINLRQKRWGQVVHVSRPPRRIRAP